MTDSPQAVVAAHVISGKRVVVSVVSWLLASVAVAASPTFVVAWVQGQDEYGLMAGLPLLPWIALGVMNIGWLLDRRIHWFWPIVGTATGLTSALLFIGAFVFYVAAVPLACYLVYWHLFRGSTV